MPNARLYQYLALLQSRDRIHVFHLADAEDICKFVPYFAQKAYLKELSAQPSSTRPSAQHSSKRKNREAEGPWFSMLCARAIVETYPAARMVIDQYVQHQDDPKKRIEVISKVKSGKRAIGKSVAQLIHDALYQ